MYNDITEEYLTELAKKVYDKLHVKPEPNKEENKVLEEGELPMPSEGDMEFYFSLRESMLNEVHELLIGTAEYPTDPVQYEEWMLEYICECLEEGNSTEEAKRMRSNVTPMLIAQAMEYPLAYLGSHFNPSSKVSLDIYASTLKAFNDDANSALWHITENGYICFGDYTCECYNYLAELMYIAEMCHIDLKKALDEYVGNRTLEF
nr:MAG TPA: hypothetical protein [Caudoviricetes sp.]